MENSKRKSVRIPQDVWDAVVETFNANPPLGMQHASDTRIAIYLCDEYIRRNKRTTQPTEDDLA